MALWAGQVFEAGPGILVLFFGTSVKVAVGMSVKVADGSGVGGMSTAFTSEQYPE
jgi:hypothetical protein